MTAFNAQNGTLKQASFVGMDLKGADMRWANLDHCDFTGADLSGADFTGADLAWCNFTEANLTGAIFKDADMNNVVLLRANIQNGSLENTKMRKCSLVKLDARNADLRGADLGESHCYNAKFEGSQQEGMKTDQTYGFKVNVAIQCLQAAGGDTLAANFVEKGLLGSSFFYDYGFGLRSALTT